MAGAMHRKEAMLLVSNQAPSVNWKYADEWERDARAAAGNATEMLHFLHSGTLSKEPQQPMMLQRLAEFLSLLWDRLRIDRGSLR